MRRPGITGGPSTVTLRPNDCAEECAIVQSLSLCMLQILNRVLGDVEVCCLQVEGAEGLSSTRASHQALAAHERLVGALSHRPKLVHIASSNDNRAVWSSSVGEDRR